MKRTALIATTLVLISSMAHAGDGYLNARKAQEKREAAQVVVQSDAERKAADDYAGAVIKANRDNYRNH